MIDLNVRFKTAKRFHSAVAVSQYSLQMAVADTFAKIMWLIARKWQEDYCLLAAKNAALN